MKTIRYELKIIHKKEIAVTVEDPQNAAEILQTMIPLEPDFEMPNAEFLGILVQKVDAKTCPENCENCSYLCPESMECTMKDKENRCMNCEYRCPECGACSLVDNGACENDLCEKCPWYCKECGGCNHPKGETLP